MDYVCRDFETLEVLLWEPKAVSQTQQQRYNTVHAVCHMWPSVPPENVSPGLALWRKNEPNDSPITCGSIACFGGFCQGYPLFRYQVRDWFYLYYAAETLFGDMGIFNPRNCHRADVGFTGTDHELVTHRLNWVLENSEVVA